MKIENMFYILEEDWLTLQAWAGIAYQEDKNEISGLMTAIPDKDGRFQLKDVEILKQENSGTSTELDAEAVSAYKMKHAMRYKNKKMKFVWWHSHHTMEAFWSGTDKKEIDAWENSSFSLALVINLREEYVFRVSIWNANGIPLQKHIDTSLEIVRNARPKITSKMKTLYKELCDDSTTTYVNGYNRNGWGYTVNHGYQTNLLNQGHSNTNDIDDFKHYAKVKSNVEDLINQFMVDEIPYKRFLEKLNELKAYCAKKGFKFGILVPTVNKKDAIDLLTTTNAEEFFEFESKEAEEMYEYNSSFLGGYV